MRIYKAKGKNQITNNDIPESAGVYFLFSKNELLYIGKSKNLRKRIADHFCNGLMKVHMVNPDEILKVGIILTKDEFIAMSIEDKLIKLIPTKWNKNPFYKRDWYQDWKFKEGMFAQVNS